MPRRRNARADLPPARRQPPFEPGERFVLFVDLLGFQSVIQRLGFDAVTSECGILCSGTRQLRLGLLPLFGHRRAVQELSARWHDLLERLHRRRGADLRLASPPTKYRSAARYPTANSGRPPRSRQLLLSYYGRAFIDAALEERRHNLIGIAAHDTFARMTHSALNIATLNSPPRCCCPSTRRSCHESIP